ncbi:uncharacterized protein LOC110181200 [Drosophila serrata]|uniref:uncharacterized protein LOC110181200 n=1 Tax=Drosophila serrata TaxID=7274 RepID=UPI000A1CF940|nr:uncharacterized protein LOC110181200 [Drosophila serrata]
MNLHVLLLMMILETTILAYSTWPTSSWLGTNNNYLDVRNSTLFVPRSTFYPPTHNEENEEDYDYGEDQEDHPAINVATFFHKRVPRHPGNQAVSRLQSSSRRLSFNVNAPWQQSDNDNHLNWHSAADTEDDGYQSDQAQPGELTARKLQQVGTQEGVLEYRKYHTNLQELNQMAREHRAFVQREGRCRVPKPQVIYMTKETNTVYSPRATILHQCSDTVGCCDPGFTCKMKRNETVNLVFSVHVNNKSMARIVPMLNHTECGCVKVEIRRKRSTACRCPKHFIDFSWPLIQSEEEEKEQQAEQRCRCDCHLSDDTCKRLKNGEEGFSVMERRRIQSGDSSPPFCNYGPYDKRNGRCPRLVIKIKIKISIRIRI